MNPKQFHSSTPLVTPAGTVLASTKGLVVARGLGPKSWRPIIM